MRLGIKIRLQDWRKPSWERDQFDFVELHIANFERRADFLPAIEHFQARGVDLGVHYAWPLDGAFTPSFAVDEPEFKRRTLEDLRLCIDWAASLGLRYIVYHAGPRKIGRVDRTTGKLSLTAHETPADKSAELFLEHATALFTEAEARGVALVVESETEQKPVNYLFGQRPCELISLGEQHPDTIVKLAERGGPICVDFGNLTTSFASENGADHGVERAMLLEALQLFCRRVLTASTIVVHVSGVLPPFLMDTRSGLNFLEIEEGVFPNRDEARALLAEFVGHPNTFVLPEGTPWNASWHNRLLLQMINEIDRT